MFKVLLYIEISLKKYAILFRKLKNKCVFTFLTFLELYLQREDHSQIIN